MIDISYPELAPKVGTERPNAGSTNWPRNWQDVEVRAYSQALGEWMIVCAGNVALYWADRNKRGPFEFVRWRPLISPSWEHNRSAGKHERIMQRPLL